MKITEFPTEITKVMEEEEIGFIYTVEQKIWVTDYCFYVYLSLMPIPLQRKDCTHKYNYNTNS